MIDYVRNRETITQRVLDLQPVDTSYDYAIKHWWYISTTHSTNLRLTDQGDLAFRLAELEYTDLPYTNGLIAEGFAAILKKLGNLECPFYLGVGSKNQNSLSVRLYDSRVAMMAILHGTVEKYLDSQLKKTK